MLLIQVDWVAEFADLGMIEPLDEWIAKEPKEFFANIPPTFHQKWRGKQHYLPIESGAVALFYNTELFKEAGIAGPPKTWDEFVETAKKLTNPDKVIRYHGHAGGRAADQHDLRHLSALLQAGGEIIDEKTNKAVFNSPAGVKAVQWYVDRNVNKVNGAGRAEQRGEGEARQFRLRQHRHDVRGAVGHRHSEAAQPQPELRYRDTAHGQDHRHDGARLAERGDHPGPEQGSGLEVHPVDVGPRGHRDVGEGDRGLPGAEGCAEKPWFKENKLFQAFVQQMGLPNAQCPILGMPNAVQMNKIMTTEIQNAVQAKKSAQQALDDAAAEWNKILAKYQK